MISLFLDANVLFTAAHNPDGKASFIIALGTEGIWKLFTSALAIEEARRNLVAKCPDARSRFQDLLGSINIVPEQMDAPFPDGLPEKDRPIFQAAFACRATHLITGDILHFGRLMMKPKKTFGILIMTAARFLQSV